jgi:hypothetical protein
MLIPRPTEKKRFSRKMKMSGLVNLSFFMVMILGFICISSGSEIHFRGSGAITPLLTGNLTLVCELNETVHPTSSGAIVGRRRRDVTQTVENTHPVAIFITRKDKKIASISQFVHAKALVSDPNMYVTGKFEGGPRYNGYLEVRFEYPTRNETGDYKCEVTTLTDDGHGVTFSQNVSIDLSSPSMDDLVDEMISLHLDTRQQQAVINDLKTQNHNQSLQIQTLKTQTQTLITETQTLKTENNNQSLQIQTLKTQNHNQDAQIQSLKTETQTLKTQNIDLTRKLQTSQTDITNLKHTETGYIECGDSRHSDWSDGYSSAYGHDGRVITKTQRFKETYSQPPVVFLSIIEPYFHQDKSPGGDKGFHYGVSLESVNKDTFVVKCYAEDDYGFINRLRATWISFAFAHF